MPIVACLLLVACGKPSDTAADRPPAELARNETPAPTDSPGLISKQLIPNENGVCRFEERDPKDRPGGLLQTNRGANMIFWADTGAALWDHPNGLIYDEGMVIPGKRIVAARDGMKDLWISPAVAGPIYLYSGPEIFECRRPSAR